MIEHTLYKINDYGGDPTTTVSYRLWKDDKLVDELKGLIIQDYNKETGIVNKVYFSTDPAEILLYADMIFSNPEKTRAQCNHTFVRKIYGIDKHINFVNKLSI